MTLFDVERIRCELSAALVVLAEVPLGLEQTGSTPLRALALRHVRTAALLLTGTPLCDIIPYADT